MASNPTAPRKDRDRVDNRSNPSEITNQSGSADSYVRPRGPASSATTPSRDVAIRSQSSKHPPGSEVDAAASSSAYPDQENREGPRTVESKDVIQNLRNVFDKAKDQPRDVLKEIFGITKRFQKHIYWKISHHKESFPDVAIPWSNNRSDDWLDRGIDERSGAQETFTDTLDEYLSKVGDLTIEIDRYLQFVREWKELRRIKQTYGGINSAESVSAFDHETRSRGEGLQEEYADVQAWERQTHGPISSAESESAFHDEARNRVEKLQEQYADVQAWERKCYEENSLHKFRDDEESQHVYLDTAGGRESELYGYKFMRPVSDWHYRLRNKEFEILSSGLPAPPAPPHPSSNPTFVAASRLPAVVFPSSEGLVIRALAPPLGEEGTGPLDLPIPPDCSFEEAVPRIQSCWDLDHVSYEYSSMPDEIFGEPSSGDSDQDSTPTLEPDTAPSPNSINHRTKVQDALSSESSQKQQLDNVSSSIDAPVLDEPSDRMGPIVQQTLQEIWGQSLSSGSEPDPDIRNVIYQISWELPTFFATHVPHGSKLGSLLTLTTTESADDAFATSCEEYISHIWGALGTLVLHAAEMLLSSDRGEAESSKARIIITQDAEFVQRFTSMEYKTSPLDATDNPTPYLSTATVQVEGSFSDQVSIASAFAWLCSAIRLSPDGITISPATVKKSAKTTDPPTIDISLAGLECPPLTTSQSCWHKLFKSQVIANGFPIPTRKSGRGLEISYSNMVALARSLSLTRVYDGLVAEGLRTVLIPIEDLPQAEESAVQWHLMIKPLDESIPTRPTFRILTQEMFDNISLDSWYQELDSNKLSSRRAFLGWVPTALVHAGSIESDTKVTTSGLPEIDARRRLLTMGGSIGLSFAPIASTISMTSTFASVTPGIITLEAPTITTTLQNARDSQHAIIYDNESKIGWHISRASLILYLAHIVIDKRREEVAKSDAKAIAQHIPPYPEPATDGSNSAYDAIDLGWEWEIPRETRSVERSAPPSQLSWLVRNIIKNLIKVENDLMLTRAEAEKCGKIAPKSVIGVELLDLALSKSILLIKEREVHQAWAHFTEKEPLVLFCGKLRPLIVPSEKAYSRKSLCRNWKSVPEGQDYLVATGHTIKYLLESNSPGGQARLGKSILWPISKSDPTFELHPSYETQCRHLQILKSSTHHDHDAESEMLKRLEYDIDGAFIFGNQTPADFPKHGKGYHLPKHRSIPRSPPPSQSLADPPSLDAPSLFHAFGPLPPAPGPSSRTADQSLHDETRQHSDDGKDMIEWPFRTNNSQSTRSVDVKGLSRTAVTPGTGFRQAVDRQDVSLPSDRSNRITSGVKTSTVSRDAEIDHASSSRILSTEVSSKQELFNNLKPILESGSRHKGATNNDSKLHIPGANSSRSEFKTVTFSNHVESEDRTMGHSKDMDEREAAAPKATNRKSPIADEQRRKNKGRETEKDLIKAHREHQMVEGHDGKYRIEETGEHGTRAYREGSFTEGHDSEANGEGDDIATTKTRGEGSMAGEQHSEDIRGHTSIKEKRRHRQHKHGTQDRDRSRRTVR